MNFPGGSVSNESACDAGPSGDRGSIPGSRRSPGRGYGNPLQYSCLENPHGQRSLVGYGSQGHKESDTTEVTGQVHMVFKESMMPCLKLDPKVCDYLHKWIFLGRLSWLNFQIGLLRTAVKGLTLLHCGWPLLEAQNWSMWLYVEHAKLMSTNGALTKGQRKKISNSGNLHFNAVAHLSEVSQIIKPSLLTLHSRGIVCDQDKF